MEHIHHNALKGPFVTRSGAAALPTPPSGQIRQVSENGSSLSFDDTWRIVVVANSLYLPEVLQQANHPAYVVIISMGQKDITQCGDSLLLQVVKYDGVLKAIYNNGAGAVRSS